SPAVCPPVSRESPPLSTQRPSSLDGILTLMSFAPRLFLRRIPFSLPARAQTAPPLQTEQQFVATMAERFETQDKTPEPPVPEPVTPAPVEAKKPSETDPDVATPDEEPAPPSSTPKAPDESTPDPDQPLSPEPEPTADDE